jgi:hypothetical protein
MLVLVVLVSVFAVTSADPTYCLCTQEFVYDPLDACGSSGTYNLENACYRCPVVNATGTFYFCGSLPYGGYGACNQAGALAYRQAQCSAIGGNPSLTSFVCYTTTGANKSQTTGCNTGVPVATTTNAPTTSLAPSVAPVAGGPPITQSPSGAPTNDTASAVPNLLVRVVLFLALPFLLYASSS